MLAEVFEQPDAFVRSLHHMLDFYADRTYHPGLTGESPALMRAYNVRTPVLRQINHELTPLAEANPQAGLVLCDALWGEDYIEIKFLAAALLGRIPIDDEAQVFSRMHKWLLPGIEERLSKYTIQMGLANARREKPEAVLRLSVDWLGEKLFRQQLGLKILLTLVEDQNFENLPVLYRVISPWIPNSNPQLRPDILDLLKGLTRRSPVETAYFLRQSYESIQSPETAWYIRNTVDEFPVAMQASLRALVRGR